MFVLFGPTGDLARRLLFPALWRAHTHQRISGDWQLVGTARSPKTDDGLRHEARHGIEEHPGGAVDEDVWRDFASRINYCRADLVNGSGDELARMLAGIRPAGEHSDRPLVHYLATPSPTFGPVTGRLDALGLLTDATVVYEKPFGLDLDSYRDLERTVERHLAPERTFRLDHFLGKSALRRLVEVRRAVTAKHELQAEGVEVRLDTAAREVRADSVVLDSGEVVPSAATVWASGVQVAHAVAQWGCRKAEAGG